MLSKMLSFIPVLILACLMPTYCLDKGFPRDGTDEDHYARYEMLFDRHAAELKSRTRRRPSEDRHSLSWFEQIRQSFLPEDEQEFFPKVVI